MALAKLLPANVKYIAIHCSASPPSVYADAKVIDRWHRDRGFLRIGYHKVIKRDGVVEDGRSIDEVGAHIEGYNSVSVGVVLVGGVDEHNVPSDNFTSIQKNSLIKVIHALLVRFPNATVQGHRDFPNVAKACPSFQVKEWWKTVNHP